jgi:UDP-2-acetamido-3-amino-2,3-dideoxy-glucuronate N-acetyltransferase
MPKVHSLADVQTQNIGSGTTIWQFCVILKNAQIGSNCNINCQVLIENEVIIGNNVTVKPGVQLWDGIIIMDDVFIGPNVTFTNDLVPRSKQYPEAFAKTVIETGASLGANATIIAGNTIGKYALVGAGSVVTQNVPAYAVFFGNPAKHKGFVTKEGVLVNLEFKDKNNNEYVFLNEELTLK